MRHSAAPGTPALQLGVAATQFVCLVAVFPCHHLLPRFCHSRAVLSRERVYVVQQHVLHVGLLIRAEVACMPGVIRGHPMPCSCEASWLLHLIAVPWQLLSLVTLTHAGHLGWLLVWRQISSSSTETFCLSRPAQFCGWVCARVCFVLSISKHRTNKDALRQHATQGR